MRQRITRKLLIGALAALSAVVGCVLGGPEEPGCTEDAECGAGFSCRAGACFREESRGGAVPSDAGDASTKDADVDDGGDMNDASDASEDASDSGDASSD